LAESITGNVFERSYQDAEKKKLQAAKANAEIMEHSFQNVQRIGKEDPRIKRILDRNQLTVTFYYGMD
jgi:hypothetical protein